jgi:hypothetical protein
MGALVAVGARRACQTKGISGNFFGRLSSGPSPGDVARAALTPAYHSPWQLDTVPSGSSIFLHHSLYFFIL